MILTDHIFIQKLFYFGRLGKREGSTDRIFYFLILFFTDGEPTALTLNLAILGTSTCSNKNNKVGTIAISSNITSFFGIERHDIIVSANDLDIVVATAAYPNNSSSNCGYAASSYGGSISADVSGMPTTDIYGNDGAFNYQTPINTTGGLMATADSSTNASNFRRAAYNAAVSASVRARSAANPNNGFPALTNVVIYGIGLTNSPGGPDDDFMQYVANDPANTTHYNSVYQPGLYVNAASSDDLGEAFNRIASEVLRLAK